MKKMIAVIHVEADDDGVNRLELSGPAPTVKAGVLAIVEEISKLEGISPKQYVQQMLMIVTSRDAIVQSHKDFFDKVKKMQERCAQGDCSNCDVDHAAIEEEWKKIEQEAKEKAKEPAANIYSQETASDANKEIAH